MTLDQIGTPAHRKITRQYIESFNGPTYVGPKMMAAIELLYKEIDQPVPKGVILYDIGRVQGSVKETVSI